jgi:hypothetical protein
MYQFAATQLATIAAHADGPTEADFIRWAGVAVTFAGILIAAPKGVFRILQTVNSACWFAVGWVLYKTGINKKFSSGFSELFPFAVPILKVVGIPVLKWILDQARKHADTGKPSEDEPGTAVQINWDQSAPLEAKVERLYTIVGQVSEQISIVQRAAESRDAKLDRASHDLRDLAAKLEKRMNEADLGAAKADARGVILIGVGAILAGIPDELAQVAWVGWLAFAIALLLFSGVVLTIVQEWRAAARARRTAQS